MKDMILASGYGSDTTAEQTKILNMVYKEVAGIRRWSWTEQVSTGALTTGVRTVAMPATITKVDQFFIDTSTQEPFELRFQPQEVFFNMADPDPAVGEPLYWTEFDGLLYVYPTPVMNYTTTLYGLEEIGELTLDTDVPVFDSKYHPVLVWGALRMLSYRQRDWSQYNVASTEFRGLIREMEQGENRESRGNEVHHWDGWKFVK